MIIENFIEDADRNKLRNWLIANAQTEKCCWVVVSIKEQDNTLLYLDAVEEALCFGWIDGIKKKNEHGQLMQRLSPRNKKSNWTELNKQRVKRLIKLNLMTDLGLVEYNKIKNEEFTIDDYILEELKKDEEVFNNYNSFPHLYKLIRIDSIQQVRGEETYYNRLDKFISNTKLNKLYGQYNDNGRLE